MKSDDASAASTAASDRPGDRLFSHNARLGMVMFLIYLAVYCGFVLISAFAPQLMSHQVDALGGVNVAIVYGMVLIVAALVLAIVYMALCRAEELEVKP